MRHGEGQISTDSARGSREKKSEKGPREGRVSKDERRKEENAEEVEDRGRKECSGSEKQSETYELILIGGDSGEYRLWEYEGLVRFLLEVRYWLGGARLRSLHQVNPRLVFVHRVQHQLE